MPSTTQPATATRPDDTISIAVGGLSLEGWQSVRISRGAERCPADFELQVTERYPLSATSIPIVPGAPCVVRAGEDVVITGYIDTYNPSFSSRTHNVIITGRSKCADLVDCSALVPNSQLGQGTPSSIANALTAPFGITVAGDIAAPQIIQPISVTLGETPWEIIEKISRYAACLVYDTPDGNLLMAPVGSQRHSYGFSEGVNVQSADVAFTMSDRYSRYIAVMFSTQSLTELGNSGNLLGESDDAGVMRFRPLVIVSEQFVQGQSIATKRALWEMRRRFGRSQAVTLVCDNWRDSNGMLWTPNMLAPINLPTLKLPGLEWIITEVTYEKTAETGTQARVTLMAPEALSVEPSDLQAYDVQLQTALDDYKAALPAA